MTSQDNEATNADIEDPEHVLSELPRAHARGIIKAKLRLPSVFRTLTVVG